MDLGPLCPVYISLNFTRKFNREQNYFFTPEFSDLVVNLGYESCEKNTKFQLNISEVMPAWTNKHWDMNISILNKSNFEIFKVFKVFIVKEKNKIKV